MTDPRTVGRYEILEELGRGGFATVYKARDLTLNRLVALKVLHPFWSNDAGFAARFGREAQAAAGLNHPHIVTVYEAGQAEGQLYMAMAYLPGRTLRDLLADAGALPLERALPILTQVAEALDYAHGQGVVHRDVKPANIMVGERAGKAQATLLDFGLVKAMAGSTALTSQGTLLGSPEYMAPEQADPERAAQVGPAGDRYALGIVAYQMLTGRVPFPGNTPGTLNAHEHKPVPPPRSLRPELPEPVAQALLKMLAKSPAERYPSACAFVEELEQAGQAEDQLQLVSLYERLEAASKSGDWARVLELGGHIQAVDPGYQDVAMRLAHARQQLQSPRRVSIPLIVTGIVVLSGLLGLGLWRMGAGVWPGSAVETPAVSDTPTPVPGTTQTRPADGMSMVYVPAGSFQMGSDGRSPIAEADEKPLHRVSLDAFWIDRYEVSNAQFARFVQATGYRTDAEQEGMGWAYTKGGWQEVAGADWQHPRGPQTSISDLMGHPVVQVSWHDARAYCEWAGGRLPSEAEWEYAARGPDGPVYPWGATFDSSKANASGVDDGYERSAPVDSFPAGTSWVYALNMAGNVWEWVNDHYGPYSPQALVNPGGPSSGQYRVLRGGSWMNSTESLRAANRLMDTPDARYDSVGFRCTAGPGSLAAAATPFETPRLTNTPVPSSTPTETPRPTDTPTSAPSSTPTDTPMPTFTPQPPTPTPTLGLAATRTRPADGMLMVYVPAGTFQMGSDERDTSAREDEKPPHPVTLDAFWIDKYEVSNAQYMRCVEAGACQPSAYADDADYNGADYPVVGVSWQDAANYCGWASGRLPGEAEWEYAARGPNGLIYPWGDTFDGQRTSFCDARCTFDWKNEGYDDGYERTAPVDSFPAGASWVDALNMAGNVWEWVNDWYGNYPSQPQANPGGPASGQYRVLRGGSWFNLGQYVRAAVRYGNTPDYRSPSVGFRCVVGPGN